MKTNDGKGADTTALSIDLSLPNMIENVEGTDFSS